MKENINSVPDAGQSLFVRTMRSANALVSP